MKVPTRKVIDRGVVPLVNKVGDDGFDEYEFCGLCGCRVRRGSCPVHGKPSKQAEEIDDED